MTSCSSTSPTSSPPTIVARRLKTLRGLTPYEAICKAWTDDPNRFISNPHHQSLEPNRRRHIGGTLVRRFRAVGLDVAVANSRGPDTLTALAAEAGALETEL